jgi:hypothetical protein
MPNTKLLPILLYVIGAVALGLFIYYLVIPSTTEFINIYFEEGVGLKSAAVIAFFVSIATILLFAMVGGDGLIGEVQYMFGAFFTFFLFTWILIAWAF